MIFRFSFLFPTVLSLSVAIGMIYVRILLYFYSKRNRYPIHEIIQRVRGREGILNRV